jgi:PhnB protein
LIIFVNHYTTKFKTTFMKKPTIPEGYQQVMPYLIIKGANGFIKFMQEVFGAEEKMRHMRGESTVMHAEIKIGDSIVMLADATDEYPPRTGGFFIYVAEADEVYRKAISAGATAITPMADQPYGRSGGIQDAHGNTWWVTSPANQ